MNTTHNIVNAAPVILSEAKDLLPLNNHQQFKLLRRNKVKTTVLAATLTLASFAAMNSFAAGADDTTPTTATPVEIAPTLEQRLAILERKYENDQEAAANGAKTGTTPGASKDGFNLKSNDGGFSLRISGVIQSDYRDYFGDHNPQFNDAFLLRRIRPTFEGTLAKYVAFRITPDFANGGGTGTGTTAPTTGGTALLPDAYLELQYINAARIRFGKIKTPVGFENIQGDPVMAFNERSLTNQLVPSRDNGVQVAGDFKNGALGYQLAVLNGGVDGSTNEGETSDGKEYAGRVFIQPFKASASEWINGLGLGFAGSVGDQFGNAATSNLTSGYRTDGQQTFFTYVTGAFANGSRTRLDPHAYWYFSHIGLLGEYISSRQEVRRALTATTNANADAENTAWVAEGSWVLTGERPSFTGVKPRHIFDPKNHTWGALEVAGRYSYFKADDELFTKGFAAVATSARRAKSWSTGLNWYLNNNLRINSDYAVTSFTGGAAAGKNRATEEVLLSRVQVTF